MNNWQKTALWVASPFIAVLSAAVATVIFNVLATFGIGRVVSPDDLFYRLTLYAALIPAAGFGGAVLVYVGHAVVPSHKRQAAIAFGVLGVALFLISSYICVKNKLPTLTLVQAISAAIGCGVASLFLYRGPEPTSP